MRERLNAGQKSFQIIAEICDIKGREKDNATSIKV